MDLSVEERKQLYIQRIQDEYAATPADTNWWQYASPSYHLTSRFAADLDSEPVSGEPVLFRKPKKQGMVLAVLLLVASLLLFMIGKREFNTIYILVLLFLLIVALPILLHNKIIIRVSLDAIWLAKADKDIPWRNIVLTYIKEIHQEHPVFSLVVHYYNSDADEFRAIETELEGIALARDLAVTIESARPA